MARDDEGNRLVPSPAAWLPQGIAVHEVVEAIEKSGRTLDGEARRQVYDAAWSKSVKELTTAAPLHEWYWSGPYDPTSDLSRRYQMGLQQIDAYLKWTTDQRKPWITPKGEMAIELELRPKLGDVEVMVVIDQALINNRNRVEIIDVKTGRRPGEALQLATGAAAIETEFGVKPESGRFWMARTGKATTPVSMLDWPVSRVTEVYAELDDNIRSERFDPTPSPENCNMCPVAKYCGFAQYS